MRELLGTSHNQQAVWYDSTVSHAATHFASDHTLKDTVKLSLGDLDLTEDSIFTEINFDHEVGMTDLVSTDETDIIIYAKRVGRDIYTRFTKSRSPQPTNTITLWLVRLPETGYELKSAWFGPTVPAFPGDERETSDSKLFWKDHALVWGKQAVIENTVTNNSPW